MTIKLTPTSNWPLTFKKPLIIAGPCSAESEDQMISIAKKVEKLVGHKLPGQVMRAGHRLLSYSMDEVPTAVGA